MRRLFVFVLLVSSLVGCAGFLPSSHFGDNNTTITGFRVAMVERCTGVGLIPLASSNQFMQSVSSVLSVVTYNQDVFDAGYNDGQRTFQTIPPQSLRNDCTWVRDFIPQTIAEMGRTEASAREFLANSNAQWGQMVTPIQIPDFSAAVTRQQQASTTQQATSPVSILINTPNGVQQCIVNANGYAFCP